MFVIIKYDNEKGYPKDQNIQSLSANLQGKRDYTVYPNQGQVVKGIWFYPGPNYLHSGGR